MICPNPRWCNPFFEMPSTRSSEPKMCKLRATMAGTCERQAGCCQTKTSCDSLTFCSCEHVRSQVFGGNSGLGVGPSFFLCIFLRLFDGPSCCLSIRFHGSPAPQRYREWPSTPQNVRQKMKNMAQQARGSAVRDCRIIPVSSA